MSNKEAPDMQAAVLRYRVMAFITGCLIIIVVFVGIPLQIWGHNTIISNQVATVHGVLYIVYIVFAYMLATKLHMKTKPTVILLLAGTVPIMTFVVERWMTRTYINPALAEQSAQAAPVSS
jgi:integral membrane protein